MIALFVCDVGDRTYGPGHGSGGYGRGWNGEVGQVSVVGSGFASFGSIALPSTDGPECEHS